MEYQHQNIEKKWQAIWKQKKVYAVDHTCSKPKYYALDMFPYPSGAGLHVGHPLGYIASDIYARYKKLNGFNVLHPMGTTLSDFPQNNTPFKPENIQKRLRTKYSPLS